MDGAGKSEEFVDAPGETVEFDADFVTILVIFDKVVDEMPEGGKVGEIELGPLA